MAAYPPIRIALFAYGGIQAQTQQSLLAEMRYAAQRGVQLEYRGVSASAMIDKSRSAALTEWYRTTDEGVLFMIDHDMQWRPGDVVETARLAAECKSIVGALYARKGLGKGLTSNDGGSERSLSVGTAEHQLTPCRYVASGLLAIDRSVPDRLWEELNTESASYQAKLGQAMGKADLSALESLIPLGITQTHQTASGDERSTIIDWFRPVRIRREDQRWVWLGEDFSFSLRCLHCGIEPRINTRPMPVHWGDHGFTVQDGVQKPGTKG
ncbi:MAG: hypothetical protein AAGH19_03040 [Pseudomonadota bacterium]